MAALMPPDPGVEMPEAFRYWRLCQQWGPWWSGGTANQPHLQLMEFAICSSTHASFLDEQQNMEQILIEMNTSGPTSTVHLQ